MESVFQHRDSNPWPSNPDSVLFCNQSFLFGRFDFDGSTRLVADLLFPRNEQTHLNWMEPFLMTQIARLKNAIVIVWELIPSWSLTLKLITRNDCHALRAAVVALWCSEHLVNKMSWVHILLLLVLPKRQWVASMFIVLDLRRKKTEQSIQLHLCARACASKQLNWTF